MTQDRTIGFVPYDPEGNAGMDGVQERFRGSSKGPASMRESGELKPCPFERGTCDPECLDIVVETDSSQRPGVFHGYVMCCNCGSRGPEAWADEDSIRSMAAFGWNDRAAILSVTKE